MAWIDYKKMYDFVPHSWINECMELFGIADNVRNFFENSMEQWKLSLTSNGDIDAREISGRFQKEVKVLWVSMFNVTT